MIIFVRHGESEYNIKNLVQGWTDNPLTEKGVYDANSVSKKLEDTEIDLIVCSPLMRARKTAEIINKCHNKKICIDKRLLERGKGSFEGTSSADIEAKALFDQDPKKFGGETKQEFFERVYECFKEIESMNKNVLIVSHGDVFNAIYKIVNNIPFTQKVKNPITNCGIYICQKESENF